MISVQGFVWKEGIFICFDTEVEGNFFSSIILHYIYIFSETDNKGIWSSGMILA
jgi:hypothetical protein